MKYCSRCGLRVEDNTSLCSKCGGMDFMSEEEKMRMSNGQAAPNRRPAQNPGMGANRPVRPNGTQPTRPQGQNMAGQRPMNNGGQQMGGQRPMQNGGQPMGGQRPMQNGGQPMGGQRPTLAKGPQGQQANADLGGYNSNMQNAGYQQNMYDDNQGMNDADVFNTDMPETVDNSKKKKKKEKAPKQPKEARPQADAATVSVKDWLILWFKLIIPILNIIVIIQILTDKNGKYNESIRNYVKAYMIMFAISLVAGLAGSAAVTALIGSML